jgi:hypothetical protein
MESVVGVRLACGCFRSIPTPPVNLAPPSSSHLSSFLPAHPLTPLACFVSQRNSADDRARSTPPTAHLQPPLRATRGNNRQCRSNTRAHLVALHPVVVTPTSRSGQKLAGVHSWAIDIAGGRNPRSPRWALSPLSNLVRPIWIWRIKLTHLSEQVPTDPDCPDLLKSDGSSHWSDRTGINESELATWAAPV